MVGLSSGNRDESIIVPTGGWHPRRYRHIDAAMTEFGMTGYRKIIHTQMRFSAYLMTPLSATLQAIMERFNTGGSKRRITNCKVSKFPLSVISACSFSRDLHQAYY